MQVETVYDISGFGEKFIQMLFLCFFIFIIAIGRLFLVFIDFFQLFLEFINIIFKTFYPLLCGQGLLDEFKNNKHLKSDVFWKKIITDLQLPCVSQHTYQICLGQKSYGRKIYHNFYTFKVMQLLSAEKM